MASSRITRRVATVATGRAANVVSAVLVNALLARGWAIDQVGVCLTLLVLVNSLLPLFQLGLPTSLLFFFPRKNGQEQLELILQTVLLLSASGVLLCAVLYLLGSAIAGLLGSFEAGGIEVFLLPFLPFAFALVAGGFADAVLVATDRSRWMAGLAISHAAATVAVVGLAALYERPLQELLALFSLVACGRLVAGGVLVMRAARSLEGRWRVTSEGLSAYCRYSVAVGLTDAIGGLSRFVDRYVVLFFFAVASFSLYQFGAIEVPVAILVTAVATVMIPEVSKRYADGRHGEIAALWRQSVGRLAMGVLPIFCFLFVFSGPLFELYLPAKFSESAWVFRIFLVALPLRCATYNAVLVGMGKASWALWGSLLDLVLNLLLSILLVLVLLDIAPGLAFLGPAVATVTATYIQVGLLVVLIGWHLDWPFQTLLPWARLGAVLGLSCGAALIAWFAATASDSASIKIVLGGGVFASVVALSYGAVPAFKAELRAVWSGVHER